MSDPTSRTRFSSVFPKKAWVISCKTYPDPIWMAWSEFGQTHLGREQAGVQKLIGLVCGKVQQARYQFATFRLSSVLPETCRIISCQTSSDHIVPNQLGSYRAKPAGIISCQTSSDHIVPNQLGAYRAKPARIISCQTSSDPILIRLTVSGFGQTDPVWVQAGERESSGLLLANASGPIRIGYKSDPVCLTITITTIYFINPSGKLKLSFERTTKNISQ